MTATALHGSDSRYQTGCRCLLCADAHRAYQQNYRARRIAEGSWGRKVSEVWLEGVVVGHRITESSATRADL